MTYAHIQHPIVLRRSQPLLISRERDESDATDADRGAMRETDQPAPRHRQGRVGPLPRERRQRAEAHGETDQPLPPECWYG